MKKFSLVIVAVVLLVCVSLTLAAPQGTPPPSQAATQTASDKVCIKGNHNSILDLLKLLLNVNIPIKILSA